MKRCVLTGLCWVVGSLVPSMALADSKSVCVEASSRGQILRDEHKLVEAPDALRGRAAVGCPAIVQNDCAGWLAEVEKALPSVVASAKNGAGEDLFDVKVSMDG